MDQSSHQQQKGQPAGLVGPQALFCQSLINKSNLVASQSALLQIASMFCHFHFFGETHDRCGISEINIRNAIWHKFFFFFVWPEVGEGMMVFKHLN